MMPGNDILKCQVLSRWWKVEMLLSHPVECSRHEVQEPLNAGHRATRSRSPVTWHQQTAGVVCRPKANFIFLQCHTQGSEGHRKWRTWSRQSWKWQLLTRTHWTASPSVLQHCQPQSWYAHSISSRQFLHCWQSRQRRRSSAVFFHWRCSKSSHCSVHIVVTWGGRLLWSLSSGASR